MNVDVTAEETTAGQLDTAGGIEIYQVDGSWMGPLCSIP